MTPLPVLVVQARDPTPPYEQLRRQLADLIGSRVLAPGSRLPPLRQLAGDLGLAVGTVGRTYRELEAAGLVRSRRGGGTRVTGSAAADTRPESAGEDRDRLLAGHAAEYVRAARGVGVDPPAILAAVQQQLTLDPG